MKLVKEIMTEAVVSATLEDQLRHAQQLMRTHRIRHIPILNHNTGKLIGIISDRELAGLASYTEWFGLGKDAYDAFLDRSIADAMPRRFFREGGVITAKASTPLNEVVDIFVENKLSSIPIVSDENHDTLVGIVSYLDVLHAVRPLF